MKIFMFKCTILATLMFISVLAGMQMANNGIQNLKGSSNLDIQNAVTINRGNQSSSSLLGSHDLSAKQKKLEEMNSFNLFSSMGKKMSDGITKASEKAIQKILK